jgi:hypothetical protein
LLSIPKESSQSAALKVNQYFDLLLKLQSNSLPRNTVLMGAGIGSSWLMAYSDLEPIALVDEDPKKWGKSWMRKEILEPRQVPVERTVVIPFSQKESSEISGRWRAQYGLSCLGIGELID